MTASPGSGLSDGPLGVHLQPDRTGRYLSELRNAHEREEVRKGVKRSFVAVADSGVSSRRFPAAPLAGFSKGS